MSLRLSSLLLVIAFGCQDAADGPIPPVHNGQGAIVDADDDGFYSDEECDDGDTMVNPGVTEVCDLIDNNCDGLVDEDVKTTFFADEDGDGAGDASRTIEACTRPAGYVVAGTDCDDSNEDNRPAAVEQCDGVDNNCDDVVDEGCEGVAPPMDGDDGDWDTGDWDTGA